MRVLTLETSGRSGSAALLRAGGNAASEIEVLEEQPMPPGVRTAQALLPVVQALLKRHGWTARGIDAVAVAAGPGSFTGLRVGVVTAKTLAFATQARLIGVNTLSAMATESMRVAPSASLWAILDAQREELFAARFTAADVSDLKVLHRPHARIVPVETWLGELKSGDIVTGPPLSKWIERLPRDVGCTPETAWSPTAAGVGRLGIRLLAAGIESDPVQLVPDYLRLSAAEEKSLVNRGAGAARHRDDAG